jgi:hypothetical protein
VLLLLCHALLLLLLLPQLLLQSCNVLLLFCQLPFLAMDVPVCFIKTLLQSHSIRLAPWAAL